MGEETFYVTTPIYYVNAKPHLGHAYTTLVVDTLTKFNRQRGVDSFFLTGTDEHGINIERAAEARGIPVQQHVDQVVDEFKTAFRRLGVEYDRWIRTSDPYHEQTVRSYGRPSMNAGLSQGKLRRLVLRLLQRVQRRQAKTRSLLAYSRAATRSGRRESYFFKLSAFGAAARSVRVATGTVQPDVRRNE